MYIKPIILLFIVFHTISFSTYKPKPLTATQMRKNYVTALTSYEGTAYSISGDEWGVSCSSLVFKALKNTSGINKFISSETQPRACLSDELRSGCDGQLSSVLEAASLNNIDYSKIQPGDIAVIGDKAGVHTLAYAGNETWIHADPLTGKVIKSKAPDNNSPWFTLNASVMRWNIFND